LRETVSPISVNLFGIPKLNRGIFTGASDRVSSIPRPVCQKRSRKESLFKDQTLSRAPPFSGSTLQSNNPEKKTLTGRYLLGDHTARGCFLREHSQGIPFQGKCQKGYMLKRLTLSSATQKKVNPFEIDLRKVSLTELVFFRK